jgi:hypothetical protein
MTETMVSVSVSAAVADVGVVADMVAGTEMSSGGAVSSIEGGFTSLSVSFISSDWTAGIAAAADAVAGAVADVAAVVSVGTEMSSDGIVLAPIFLHCWFCLSFQIRHLQPQQEQ